MANKFKVNTLILSGSTVIAASGSLFVNGIPVVTGATNLSSAIFTVGDQTISGLKIFVNTGIFSSNISSLNPPPLATLWAISADDVATRIVADTYNSLNTFGSSFRGRRARGTNTSPSGVQTDDTFIQITADAHHGSGFNNSIASIGFHAESSHTSGNAPTYATVRVTPSGSATSVEALRVNSKGYLGVKNTNPQFQLDISGSGNFSQGLLVSGVPVLTGINNLTGCRNTQFSMQINAGSSTISTGFKGYTRIERNLTILGWELVANTSGTVSIDLWKTGFANFPPTSSNSIVAGLYPQLNNQLTNFTGSVPTWTINCSQGDYIGFTVNSGVSGVSLIDLTVYGISI